MKNKIVIAALLCTIALSIAVVTRLQSQNIVKSYSVKLYSGGTVVGSWQANQIGESGGESLTFFIGSQTFPKQVKIRGTYSVEQIQ